MSSSSVVEVYDIVGLVTCESRSIGDGEARGTASLLAYPSIDGRGVGSEIPRPRPSFFTIGCGLSVFPDSVVGCVATVVSIAKGFSSRFSRAAPRPKSATFRRDPLRFRVFCCWEIAATRARGGLLEGSGWAAECRDSLLRLDLLSEVRRKGNLDRILPPEPLLLRPPIAISGEDPFWLCGWVGGTFSILYRNSWFAVLHVGRAS